MRYYTLQLNGTTPAYYPGTDWNGLCQRTTQIIATWLERACMDRSVTDAQFQQVDNVQRGFAYNKAVDLPFSLALPRAKELEPMTLTIAQDTLEVNQVVLFGDSQAGHISAVGGSGPWPVISDVPGERGETYWLRLGQFTPTSYTTTYGS